MAATADIRLEKDKASGHFRLSGALDLYHAPAARKLLRKTASGATLDVSGLDKLDTVGALLLRQLQEKNVTLERLKPDYEGLFKLVAKADMTPPKPEKPKNIWLALVETTGEKTVGFYRSAVEMTGFLGQACVVFSRAIPSRKHWRFADIMHHIDETGIKAIPIIGLMAFMIAIVIAYQAVAQLRPLGAEHLTVNLVTISVLREMGVLLTAIMVAGRSGSAFTAQIGVMKVREEVDALQVIGIDPFEVLVLPRLIALVISLPLLTFLADMMGLFGGGVMSMLLIDIPLPQYFERAQAVASGNDFLVGMIKAPIFAFLIAMVGCMHGMKVSGSAESVGTETTASVVQSIFLVLVADAFFSIAFDKMGI